MHTCFFFFFNDTATTEIYTLSLHDALPISCGTNLRPAELQSCSRASDDRLAYRTHRGAPRAHSGDRKSTRLNSSHSQISYAVFCLKKKKKNINSPTSHDHHPLRHQHHTCNH